ncbi:hypothetical protein CAPTEDRAFT_214935, partial [Capitella teleta]
RLADDTQVYPIGPVFTKRLADEPTEEVVRINSETKRRVIIVDQDPGESTISILKNLAQFKSSLTKHANHKFDCSKRGLKLDGNESMDQGDELTQDLTVSIVESQPSHVFSKRFIDESEVGSWEFEESICSELKEEPYMFKSPITLLAPDAEIVVEGRCN